MKKILVTLLVLTVLGGGGYYAYEAYIAPRMAADTVAAQSVPTYSEYTLENGTVTSTVSGSGSLEMSNTYALSLGYEVTITSVLASVGSEVTADTPLFAVDTDALQSTLTTTQETLATCESDIATLSNDSTTTSYVYMPQTGRIKEVYVAEGMYIEQVMEEQGCIALVSLDGRMLVDFTPTDDMEIQDRVYVEIGNSKISATISALSDDKATLYFSDEYGTDGGQVEVLDVDGISLGTYTSYISVPFRLTTSAEGYIDTLYLEEDGKRWTNNYVAYLINVPMNAQYHTLVNTRDSLNNQIKQINAILETGIITAGETGIVGAISAASSTPVAANTELCSLYVGDQKQMVVAIDELDIITIKQGQTATISLDAITTQEYTGTVTAISQIGTSSMGVTTYDVTLDVNGDSMLKIGMNGTAIITVQEVNDVVLLPLGALQTMKGESFVWLQGTPVNEGEIGVRQTIQTGLSDENFVEVTQGLAAGDVVLIPRIATTTTDTSNSNMMNMGMMDMGSMSNMGSMPSDRGNMSGGGPSGR